MVTDPRSPNCKAFHVNASGQVDGVELVYEAIPEAQYELVYVHLIDEAAAQGNTVATCTVLNKDGIDVAEPVYLAWPWPDLNNHALPGNPDGKHMITNGYTPPVIGPLALYVGDAQGVVRSDVIGGLGLPWNRHISFACVWKERSAEPEPPPDPKPEPEPDLSEFQAHIVDELADLNANAEAIKTATAESAAESKATHALLASINGMLAKLAAHLGA